MGQHLFIGKSIPRVDGPVKATGEAVYSSDIKLPGMLTGKCKRSPHPFARILSIDISKAMKLTGVSAVITARNVTQSYFGEFVMDQFPLCDQYAHYVGDEVAAVAAIDEDVAEEALDLIEVEYELLTPVFNPEEALKPGAPAVHPELEGVKQNVAFHIDFERGEGEAAFKQAEVILEERFTTQTMHQCYLQPRDCVAAWEGDRLTLWAVMQSPYRMRLPIARAVGVPEDRVRLVPGYVGGGFGNNTASIWPIAALLARKVGKPVRLVLTREEDFVSGRPLPSAIFDMKIGFTRNGTMVAKKMNMSMDTGAYVGSSRGILAVASIHEDNMYRLANLKTSSKLVYTNNVPRGALRGYGNQLTTFALESMIDMAAKELDIDPAEIRLKNASRKGDTSVHGFIFNSCGLSEAVQIAAEKSGWREKKRGMGKNYGIGMASALHSCGARNLFPIFEGSAAIVQVDQLGKVRVLSGELDIGQGSTTVFAQIAAEELGVDIEDVKVSPVDTDVSPFAKGSCASRVTPLGGAAVQKAAADARRQLLSYAAETLKTNVDKLELKDKRFYVKGSAEPIATLEEIAHRAVFHRSGLPLIGEGIYKVPDNVVNVTPASQYYGNYSVAYTLLAQIAEVYVDPETGKVDVLNLWSAVDLGKAINPRSCEGQVEGGVMMGLGYALSEDYIVDKGKMLNPGYRDYQVPRFSSTPQIHSFFIETIDPEIPYGAKGISEAICNTTAAVIANAVYNAIGVRIKDLPITSEKILRALKNKEDRNYLKGRGKRRDLII